MMPQLHETGIGQKFFEGTLPRIAKSLAEIAKELKRSNDLKEAELEREKNRADAEIAQDLDYMESLAGRADEKYSG